MGVVDARTVRVPGGVGRGAARTTCDAARIRGAYGTSIVTLEKIEGPVLFVRGLDCLDGTPLLDLKPDRTLFKPLAPAQAGDFQVGDK